MEPSSNLSVASVLRFDRSTAGMDRERLRLAMNNPDRCTADVAWLVGTVAGGRAKVGRRGLGKDVVVLAAVHEMKKIFSFLSVLVFLGEEGNRNRFPCLSCPIFTVMFFQISQFM